MKKILFLLLVCFSLTVPLSAQWYPANNGLKTYNKYDRHLNSDSTAVAGDVYLVNTPVPNLYTGVKTALSRSGTGSDSLVVTLDGKYDFVQFSVDDTTDTGSSADSIQAYTWSVGLGKWVKVGVRSMQDYIVYPVASPGNGIAATFMVVDPDVRKLKLVVANLRKYTALRTNVAVKAKR